MAYDPEKLDVHIGAENKPWVDPTDYGEGNNIPPGHIALRGEIEDEATVSPVFEDPILEEIIKDAIENAELR